MSDDKFMSELGEFIKKRGEPGSDEDLFPTSITVEEQVFGFKLAVIALKSSHIRAAVADLGAGQYAIKVKDPGDEVSYAICNGQGQPVRSPLPTVHALRESFPYQEYGAIPTGRGHT